MATSGGGSPFRPFTRESLEAIESRKAEKRELSVQEGDDEPDEKFAEGEYLPKSLRPFLSVELISKQLEDIDPHYSTKKTFIVINKCKEIFRFNAEKSLWLFDSFHPIRQAAIAVHTHPIFNLLMIAIIMVNSILLAIHSRGPILASQPFFLVVYSLECLIKIVAKGFSLSKFSYLNDSLNRWDFILTICLLAKISTLYTLVIDSGILRLVRLLIVWPRLRPLGRASIAAVCRSFEVILFMFLFMLLYAALGLQLYMGVLTQRCVLNFPENANFSHEAAKEHYDNPKNWLDSSHDGGTCGNTTSSFACPQNYTCLQGHATNPDFGFTNFDNFGWSLLGTLRIMTIDYWEALFRSVIYGGGYWHTMFFIPLIYIGYYFYLNLLMVSIAVYFNKCFKYPPHPDDQEGSNKGDKQTDRLEDIPLFDRSLNSTGLNSSGLDNTDIENGVNKETTGRKSAPSLTTKCSTCWSQFTDKFCVWNCCSCWTTSAKFLERIVFDAFFEVFIMVCVVLHMAIMAMDHHGMHAEFYQVLNQANLIFNLIFLAEVILKFFALAPKRYFKDGWNIFDFVIVLCFIMSLVLESYHLFFFPVFRVFKLARVWPRLKETLNVLLDRSGVIHSMFIYFFIIVFILTVVGMQEFGPGFLEKHGNESTMRWHYMDFPHSLANVLRALFGEWIEPLWDCMDAVGMGCVPFYMAIVVIRFSLGFGLAFAVYFKVFGVNKPTYAKFDPETNKLAEAVERIRALCRRCRGTKEQPLLSEHGNEPNDTQINVLPKDGIENDNEQATVGRNGHSTKRNLDEESIKRGIPPKCWPPFCYSTIGWCGQTDTDYWTKWGLVRSKALQFTNGRFWDCLVFVVMLVSILALVFEDKHILQKPVLNDILQYVDKAFIFFILVEMLLNWTALGFYKYFTQQWYLLQFLIVMVSVYACCIQYIPFFKAMRALRSLRLVLLLSHTKGTKPVPVTFVKMIPAVIKVLLVCNVFWFVWAILGVQMFAGRFLQCIDDEGRTLSHMNVSNMEDCMEHSNYSWINEATNFDTIGNAYFLMTFVATFKGWIAPLHSAADVHHHFGMQPVFESNYNSFLYFVCIALTAGLLTWYLIVAEAVAIFHKEKLMDDELEFSMTPEQKKVYRALKNARSRKPTKATPPPNSKCQATLFRYTTSLWYELGMSLVILLFIICLCTDHYDINMTHAKILEVFNLVFVAIFVLDVVLKLIGQRHHYFKSALNVMDFTITLCQVFGVILLGVVYTYVVSPTLLCLLRVIRVFRVIPLIKRISRIGFVSRVFSSAFADLATLWTLLFLIMFIYTVFGTFLFKDAEFLVDGIIDDHFNFRTFGSTILILVQVTAGGAGWDGIALRMSSIYYGSNNATECSGGAHNCPGETTGITYLMSYLFFAFVIIGNMFVAVVLEHFSQVHEDDENCMPRDDDFDKFYDHWRLFDPDATMFIKLDDLSTFVDGLGKPFKVSRPNKYSLILMNIPICKNDTVYHRDVMEALLKNYLVRKGNKIDGTVDLLADELSAERPGGVAVVSTSLRRQREEVSAQVIQVAWRKYRVTGDPSPKRRQ